MLMDWNCVVFISWKLGLGIVVAKYLNQDTGCKLPHPNEHFNKRIDISLGVEAE